MESLRQSHNFLNLTKDDRCQVTHHCVHLESNCTQNHTYRLQCTFLCHSALSNSLAKDEEPLTPVPTFNPRSPFSSLAPWLCCLLLHQILLPTSPLCTCPAFRTTRSCHACHPSCPGGKSQDSYPRPCPLLRKTVNCTAWSNQRLVHSRTRAIRKNSTVYRMMSKKTRERVQATTEPPELQPEEQTMSSRQRNGCHCRSGEAQQVV